MLILKPFLAFLISLIAIVFTGTKYVLFVPVIIIYVTAMLFIKDYQVERIPRIIFLTIISIIEFAMFSYQFYMSIKFYPQYGNIFAILLDATTILAIISSYIFYLMAYKEY